MTFFDYLPCPVNVVCNNINVYIVQEVLLYYYVYPIKNPEYREQWAVKSRNPDEILFVHYNLDVANSEQTGSYQDFEI